MNKDTLKLYAVTDRSWLGGETLSAQVEKALRGGASFVQLREKEMDRDAFLQEATEIAALCKRYGVPFVINDDVEIALACGADGVHVGQEDMAAVEARKARRRGKPHIAPRILHDPVHLRIGQPLAGVEMVEFAHTFSQTVTADGQRQQEQDEGNTLSKHMRMIDCVW